MKTKKFFLTLTFLTFSPLAMAATITVNSNVDVIADDGECTLREAVIAANNDAASGGTSGECIAGSGTGTDIILFDASTNGGPICLSITGTSEDFSETGDLDIRSDMQFVGNGADVTVIDGGNRTDGGTSSCVSSRLGDRIIHVVSSVATFTINSLTVEGGISSDFGGGIYNIGQLHVANSVVQNNSVVTTDSVGTYAGGGIFSTGAINFTNTRVTHNLLQGNTNTSEGGGVSVPTGSLDMTNSEVSSNTIDFGGSSSGGAGIMFRGTTMNITNSTIANNSFSNSTDGFGAGIFLAGTSGATNIVSSTIAGNSGATNGGGVYAQSAIINLLNTIIADNTATTNNDCFKDASTINSRGYNLIENNCDIILVTGTGADLTVDPGLGSLADNGGATYTKALSAGSSALNTGTCTDTINSNDINTDQRGKSRGDTCDIGAFETVCGDGVQTGGEECEDGNVSDDDECSSECRIQALYYYDNDGDTYGSDDGPIYTTSDDPAVVGGTLVAVNGDCDDAHNTAYPGATEICDTLDNDCDNETDEGFDVGACTVGVGACSATGVYVCSEDTFSSECDAVAGSPTTELCDGLDNDCDSTADEDFTDLGDDCSAGVGLCFDDGAIVCSEDGLATVCDAVEGSPTTELCDGLDNDCDSIADEDFTDLGDDCSAGVGLCADDGAIVCSEDGLATVCDAVAGEAATEVCGDDIDQDCSGADLSCSCGDGVITAPEACDDGSDNSDTLADACRSNCESASCGDGVVDTGEECDAGAATSTCSNVCEIISSSNNTGSGASAGASSGCSLRR